MVLVPEGFRVWYLIEFTSPNSITSSGSLSPVLESPEFLLDSTGGAAPTDDRGLFS
jgi:hypothetical protein